MNSVVKKKIRRQRATHISAHVDRSLVKCIDRVASLRHRGNRSMAIEWAITDSLNHHNPAS